LANKDHNVKQLQYLSKLRFIFASAAIDVAAATSEMSAAATTGECH